MSQPLYAVYGASGCGRGIMPIAREKLRNAGVPDGRLVFIDDGQKLTAVNGHRVMGYKEFLTIEATAHYAVLAIANSDVRQRLATHLERCR